ncbi:hypothetical protein [Streptomyces sp. NBC_01006]|uniref:hypothetical protein n=1 Tax=Streptomyces sp. NBC_01006 TaxID=2903716 RepID=UPI00386969D4
MIRTEAFEFERHVQDVADTPVVGDVRAVRDDAVSAPDREEPPVWLHGDLHPADVRVSAGTISRALDFGGMTARPASAAVGSTALPAPAAVSAESPRQTDQTA